MVCLIYDSITPHFIFLYIGEALAPDDHPTLIDTWKDMEHLLDSGTSLVILLFNKNFDSFFVNLIVIRESQEHWGLQFQYQDSNHTDRIYPDSTCR